MSDLWDFRKLNNEMFISDIFLITRFYNFSFSNLSCILSSLFCSKSDSDSEVESKHKKSKKTSDEEVDKAGGDRPEIEDIFGEELGDISDDDDEAEEKNQPEREVQNQLWHFSVISILLH